MKTIHLTLEGEACKVEPAIIFIISLVSEKFPELEMKYVGRDSECPWPPVVIKDNTPDSWL